MWQKNAARPQDIAGKGLRLSNYPNPFNPSTSIRFFIPNNLANLFVTLRIYDMQGRLVAVLLCKNLAGGEYALAWDGLDVVIDVRGIEEEMGPMSKG